MEDENVSSAAGELLSIEKLSLESRKAPNPEGVVHNSFEIGPACDEDPLDDELLAALASIDLDGVDGSDLFFPDTLEDIEFDIQGEGEQEDLLLDFDYQDVFDEQQEHQEDDTSGVDSLEGAIRDLAIGDEALENAIDDLLQIIDENHYRPAQNFPQEWLCHPCIDPEEPIFAFHTFQDNRDSFPDHWLCRPCQPEKSSRGPNTFSPLTAGQLGLSTRRKSELVSISEDHVLQDGALIAPPQLPKNLDDLLPFKFTQQEEDAMNATNPDSAQSLYQYVVSSRTEAVAAAFVLTRSFGTEIYESHHPSTPPSTPIQERVCLGHKETIYGLHFSPCGQYMATASQDATIRIWKSDTNALVSTLEGHDKKSECLRVAWASPQWCNLDARFQYVLASGGADGVVKMWTTSDITADSWECVWTMNHAVLEGRPKPPTSSNEGKDDESDNPPQVYALQFIDNWQGLTGASATAMNSFLMTSSDDFIHLWEIENKPSKDSISLNLTEVMSIRFTCLDHFGYGVSVARVTSGGLALPSDENKDPADDVNHFASDSRPRPFGGERNPNNVIFVFDASYCENNGLLGVALSDGSLRLVNGRGVCVSVLQLPGYQSHLTSFSWDATGKRLASCVATGHLILWSLDLGDGRKKVIPSCTAVLEGGHVPGRPLFGAKYCGVTDEDLVISWGVDGRLCLWDSHSNDNIHAPISTLISKADYPIYAVDVAKNSKIDESIVSRIGVAGGRDGGFLGVPVFLYDVTQDQRRFTREIKIDSLSPQKETDEIPCFSGGESSTLMQQWDREEITAEENQRRIEKIEESLLVQLLDTDENDRETK